MMGSFDHFHPVGGNHFLLLPDSNSDILEGRFKLLCPHCLSHDSGGHFSQQFRAMDPGAIHNIGAPLCKIICRF